MILGLDIGYSNLKLAYGDDADNVTTAVTPVGAGPVELMPQQLNGGTSTALQVVIDGEKWVAGVEPDRLQGWERELHEDYPSTKAYQALFYSALLSCEREVVDTLVTGLPVVHHMDDKKRKALADRLTGTHQVTPKRKVTVKNVLVVPQPAGAYMDIVNSGQETDLLEVMEEGRTVVIDPGFFSVDWVALEGGEIRYQSSGTSLKAMSMLLSATNDQIISDHGAGPGVEKIEKIVRAGKKDCLLLGQRIDLTEYLEQAATKVAGLALTPMRKSMREEGMAADVVLLTGGGAGAYQDAAKELFPRSRVIVPKNSVAANARGFWYCG